MAHKLDRLDGPVEGVPPLAGISRRRWIRQFDEAYRRLADTPASEQSGAIARQAAQNASEYFATVTELHSSPPGPLREAEPAIAELLLRFTAARRRSNATSSTAPANADPTPATCFDDLRAN